MRPAIRLRSGRGVESRQTRYSSRFESAGVYVQAAVVERVRRIVRSGLLHEFIDKPPAQRAFGQARQVGVQVDGREELAELFGAREDSRSRFEAGLHIDDDRCAQSRSGRRLVGEHLRVRSRTPLTCGRPSSAEQRSTGASPASRQPHRPSEAHSLSPEGFCGSRRVSLPARSL